MLYPGSDSAAEALPAPLRSASPKQLGRPRSAGRDIASHPVSLSDHSIEGVSAVCEPLGHSLDKGALQEVGASSMMFPAYNNPVQNWIKGAGTAGQIPISACLTFNRYTACVALHMQVVLHGLPATARDLSHGMHCKPS